MPDKADDDKSKAPGKTRLQQMKDAARDESFEPDMPEPGAAAYLLDHFWSVGPAVGEHALTYAELDRYECRMGISLTPWECRTLRRLSIEYLNEAHRATKRDCPPPFTESTDAARLQTAERKRKLSAFLD